MDRLLSIDRWVGCWRRRHRSSADQEDSRQFRELVEHVHDFGIFMLTPDGLVRTWNAGAQRIHGFRADEILGRHFRVFYAEEDRAAGLPERTLQDALETGRWEVENWRLRKDGSQFLAQVVVCPIIDDETGKHLGFAKVTRDITEPRRAQQALARTETLLWQAQKMEAIGQVTKGVAHDFNNLLTVVMSGLELLSKRVSADDAKSHRYIKIAMTAAKRGGALTRQLMAYARQQRLDPVPIDVEEMLRADEPLLVAALNGRTRLSITVEPDLRMCWADPTQLQTALLNLCINACDAMPNGGNIEIRGCNVSILDPASLRPPPVGEQDEIRAGDYVQISVDDDGEGMSPEVLKHACEPFFTTKETGKGSGLGLSQVYGFVCQSRGFMTLDSCRDGGTVVRIFLPVESTLTCG